MNTTPQIESFRRLEAKINEKFSNDLNRRLQLLQIAAVSTGVCDLEYGCHDSCPLHCAHGTPMYDEESAWYQVEEFLAV